MAGDRTSTAGKHARFGAARTWLPPFLVLAMVLHRLRASGGYIALEDDAFYYLLIARNLVETGASAAMPGVLTNGYHPLWFALVALWGWLTGFDLAALRGLEIALLLAGLAVALWALKARGFLQAAAIVVVLYTFANDTLLIGMETSLLFPAAALFIGLALRAGPTSSPTDASLLFLAAALVIGARLDAALFVLPALALLPAPRRLRLGVLAGLAATGAAYLGANHLLFGIRAAGAGTPARAPTPAPCRPCRAGSNRGRLSWRQPSAVW